MKKKLLQFSLQIIAAIVLTITLGVLNNNSVQAATDGRLIDDAIFDSAGTMSEGDIQNFLNQFPSSCLKNYSDGYPNDYFSYGGAVSAATIIRRASDYWGLNPRVILAKLQQEQSLVTGTAGCAGWRYTGAMGFNCPEGSSCPVNPENAGLSRQVMRASWLLKISKERANGNFSWEDPGDNDWVYGGPMTQGNRKRCGTCANIYYDGYNSIGSDGVFFIETGATASLYYYTPHVPSSFDNIFEGWWGSTYGGSWNFEGLDGSVSSVNSNQAVLGGSPNAIQFGSVLHSFYYDNTTRSLRWAYSDADGWHFRILDGAGGVAGSSTSGVGQDVTSIVYSGALHIFYYDLDNGNLRHAWTSNGSTWQFETLDGGGGINGRINADVGSEPSITQHGNDLHMFFYSKTGKSLRHGWWDNDTSTWYFETLEGSASAVKINPADVGKFSTTTSMGTSLQTFYYDTSHGNLRHAWLVGGTWHFENLDGDIGSIARSNADLGHFPVSLSYNSTLQLFYYDVTNGNLRHGWANSTGWHFENLDGDPGSIGRFNSDVGMYPSITPYNGGLQLYYYERANGGRLRHAWINPALGWLFETLDGAAVSVGGWRADVGINSSVTLFNDALQLFYTDATNGDLRHAWPR